MEMKVWIQSAFFVINVINVILGDINKWTRSKPVTRCAGEDVEIEFVYNDPTLSFKNYTAIKWTFRSKKNSKADAIYICYYIGNKNEFKLSKDNVAKYSDRIKWVNKTFNIQLKNLSSDDSGWYDILFTVFGAGTINSAPDNSSFLLDVNDPCVKPAAPSDCCSQLTCSTQTSSPKYSWSGDAAAGQTTPTIKVCPKNEMNYTCCIDEEKNSCTSFLVSSDCKDEEYRCCSGLQCIPQSSVCNGIQDCKDGDDEEMCVGSIACDFESPRKCEYTLTGSDIIRTIGSDGNHHISVLTQGFHLIQSPIDYIPNISYISFLIKSTHDLDNFNLRLIHADKDGLQTPLEAFSDIKATDFWVPYHATIPEGNYSIIFELSFPTLYYNGMLKLDDVAVQSGKFAEADQKGDNDKTVLIVGIVVGCVVLVVIVIAVCLCCRRKGGYIAASTKYS